MPKNSTEKKGYNIIPEKVCPHCGQEVSNPCTKKEEISTCMDVTLYFSFEPQEIFLKE